MIIEEIDQLPAGRELDALIAEKVMGLEVRDFDGEKRVRDYDPVYGPDTEVYKFPASYSTDIAAAWLVVEAIRGRVGYGRNLYFRIPSKTGLDVWSAESGNMENPQMLGSASTAPLAICRAALKAVMRGQS